MTAKEFLNLVYEPEQQRMKQITVNLDNLTLEEKHRANETLAKIKNVKTCCPMYWESVEALYGPSRDGINIGFGYYEVENPTHTFQQVLEMAGMTEEGHVHAESMALYAEDAKGVNMLTLEQRLSKEYKDLMEKLNGYKAFTMRDSFGELDEESRGLLVAQISAMETYSTILFLRGKRAAYSEKY